MGLIAQAYTLTIIVIIMIHVFSQAIIDREISLSPIPTTIVIESLDAYIAFYPGIAGGRGLCGDESFNLCTCEFLCA